MSPEVLVKPVAVDPAYDTAAFDRDVMTTYADVTALTRDTGFCPTTTIEEGLERFVAWYRDYYAV